MDAAARRVLAQQFPLTTTEQVQIGQDIVRREAAAVWRLAARLNASFSAAVETIHQSSGSVIVTGMGKAGLVGQKIAATLASLGTRAHFMHPGEAFHGDLGRIDRGDVVLMLTQSGETAEVVQLLSSIRELGVPLIAITASAKSSVGRAASHVVELGELEEACSLGLAPTTSTTAMLAVGDALALVLSRMRGFEPEDFARFHPGGSLGRRLSKVDDHMRPLDECRLASEEQAVREVLIACGKPGRRTGAVMITNADGALCGLFTDSDLARLFEHRDEDALDRSIAAAMIREPTTVRAGTLLRDAVAVLAGRKFSELPVIDANGHPVGLLDVTDIVGLDTEDDPAQAARQPRPVKPSVRIYPAEAS